MTMQARQTTTTAKPELDLRAIKARQQATWSSGDFAIIGTTLQIVGESLCEAADVRAGEEVLDVACGNGNAALAAGHRFARVTGLDYVPSLLAKAEARARAEGLGIDFVEGDAEALPFANGSFDVVLSTFGVMFAPHHVNAANELLRVCRKGGRIGLANWTPDGFIGELLATVGRHLPPPAGLLSPSMWGRREHIAELFADEVSALSIERRQFNFRYASAQHFIDVFRDYYGPTHKAFAALSPEGAHELEGDMRKLMAKYNRDGERSLIVPADYLEVVAVRR
jgi:SAM-dependent methyltransferase